MIEKTKEKAPLPVWDSLADKETSRCQAGRRKHQSYTIRGAGRSFVRPWTVGCAGRAFNRNRMTSGFKQLIIHGVTQEGARFRPSDWAERLAGVMSQFRPPGSARSHLTYSPYVLPLLVDGVRGIVVDERLRELEPLAWKFVVDFAHDNNLKTEVREA